MAYLNMKDYSNAVTYLNAFSSNDDVRGPIAKGGIGDAFVQLEQLDDAYDYYVQAAQLKSNNYTTPMYLYKAGVIGLTKSLGKELADKNIAVNAVTPAAAKTRIFDQMTEEHINYMLSKIPRNRFAKVDELASLVTWLAAEENSFSTAAVFDLSGGRATY